MGRTADPAVARTILQHLRGQDLHEAWVQNGKPGTWENMQRRGKAAMKAQPPQPAQQQQPAAATAPRPTARKAAAASSARQPAMGKKTIQGGALCADCTQARGGGGAARGRVPCGAAARVPRNADVERGARVACTSSREAWVASLGWPRAASGGAANLVQRSTTTHMMRALYETALHMLPCT